MHTGLGVASTCAQCRPNISRSHLCAPTLLRLYCYPSLYHQCRESRGYSHRKLTRRETLAPAPDKRSAELHPTSRVTQEEKTSERRLGVHQTMTILYNDAGKVSHRSTLTYVQRSIIPPPIHEGQQAQPTRWTSRRHSAALQHFHSQQG